MMRNTLYLLVIMQIKIYFALNRTKNQKGGAAFYCLVLKLGIGMGLGMGNGSNMGMEIEKVINNP